MIILVSLILMGLLFIKTGRAQEPVKQYVAVDIEVFLEMQKTYKQLRARLREIDLLKKRIEDLEAQLNVLTESRFYQKEVQDEDEEGDFYF